MSSPASSEKTSLTRVASASAWPEGCRYYDPGTINPERVQHLLTKETEYTNHILPWNISRLDMKDGHCRTQDTAYEAKGAQRLISEPVPNGTTTVLYVRQKRMLYHSRTTSAIGLDAPSWLGLLERFEVIPSFLEVLHDNNGASSCYVTGDTVNPPKSGAITANAFHVAYKIGGWGDHEVAMYARHHLKNGSNFVLVMGLVTGCIDKMKSLFERAPDATVFHAVFELLSAEQYVIERMRWSWDFDTQELEAKTGFSTFQIPGVEPLEANQLGFNKDGYVTLDGLRDVGWGSAIFGATCRSMMPHLQRYAEVCNAHHTTQMPTQTFDDLRDALAQKIEIASSQYAQIQQLRLRVSVQLDVTRTLVTQRDMQLNIEIATAAKRDSELMRRIAWVTMIFLPATFVATFFSMVFFHVGDESTVHMVIDPKIWLYPLVTVPLTLCMAMSYLAWSMGWSFVPKLHQGVNPRNMSGDVAVSKARAAFVARQALDERFPAGRQNPDEYPNRYGWFAQ